MDLCQATRTVFRSCDGTFALETTNTPTITTENKSPSYDASALLPFSSLYDVRAPREGAQRQPARLVSSLSLWRVVWPWHKWNNRSMMEQKFSADWARVLHSLVYVGMVRWAPAAAKHQQPAEEQATRRKNTRSRITGRVGLQPKRN